MIDNNRSDYINYRIERAFETLEEAEILAKNEKWNAVINRLYYASFYAVTAILISKEIETKSHDGVRIKFGQEFIRTGIFDKEMGRHFSKLFDLRTKGGYGDLFDHSQETALPLIDPTREFVEAIRQNLSIL